MGLIHGNSQRLIFQIKDRTVKLIPHQRSFPGPERGIANIKFNIRQRGVVSQAKPSVGRPFHPLYGSLPSQRISAASGKLRRVRSISSFQCPPAQMDRIPFPLLCLHQITMTGFLEKEIRIMAGSEDGICFIFRSTEAIGRLVHLIGAPNGPGPLYGLPVSFAGTGISAEQIIPPILFQYVGAFQKYLYCLIYIPNLTRHLLFCRIIFLQNQPAFIFWGNPVIRYHTHDIFSSVIVMKQRWVKSEIIKRYRIGPGPGNILCSHQIIGGIVHVAVKGRDNGVNQIKGPFVISQAGRPDSLGRPSSP